MVYQVLVPTAPIRPLHQWRGPSCRELEHNVYGSGLPSLFSCWQFKHVSSVTFISRRGHYLALSAPPLIVPKDPPLPGPGQYNIGKYNCQTMRPKPTAAFASRTERRPHTLQADVGPGPGKLFIVNNSFSVLFSWYSSLHKYSPHPRTFWNVVILSTTKLNVFIGILCNRSMWSIT